MMTTMLAARFTFALLVPAATFAVMSFGPAPGLTVPAAAQGRGGAPAPNGLFADFSRSPRVSRCAVTDLSPAEQNFVEESTRNVREKGGLVRIPVHFNVIVTTTGVGDVTPLIPEQMRVLNEAFAGSGFAFHLVSTRVFTNDAWFNAAAGSPQEVAMKAALRRGGPESLNVYTTGGDVYLGWATLPFSYKFAPSYDGVVLWWAAMPGTGLASTTPEEPDGVLTYDQGDTGTHEVGHWLGLDHTFAGGGCSHPGDKIKDTPVEAEPQFFCMQRDSCTGRRFPGLDPITNFMDYVDDVCMDNFTPDQTKRMRKSWQAFRNKKARTD